MKYRLSKGIRRLLALLISLMMLTGAVSFAEDAPAAMEETPVRLFETDEAAPEAGEAAEEPGEPDQVPDTPGEGDPEPEPPEQPEEDPPAEEPRELEASEQGGGTQEIVPQGPEDQPSEPEAEQEYDPSPAPEQMLGNESGSGNDDTPGTPEGSGNPPEAGEAEEPDGQEEPGEPEEAETPEDPEAPDGEEAPDPEDPEESETPEEPGNEEDRDPGDPDNPDPDDGQDPDDPEAPEDPENPDEEDNDDEDAPEDGELTLIGGGLLTAPETPAGEGTEETDGETSEGENPDEEDPEGEDPEALDPEEEAALIEELLADPLLASALASYYNAYEQGLLPELRNQGSNGACWAFAAIGAIEADLIRDGRAPRSIDLSELFLAYFTAHPYGPTKGDNGDVVEYHGSNYLSNGGNTTLAYRAMVNMVGPVQESSAPYGNGPGYVPDPNTQDAYQVTGVYVIDQNDRTAIKQAILDHGAVTASIMYNSGFYNRSTNSYYNDMYTGTNHAVMLVGWDDNYSAANFKRSGSSSTPSTNGAYLVRNSWWSGSQAPGTNLYNSSGYFWISYDDLGLLNGEEMIAFDAEALLYDACYARDQVAYPDWYTYAPGEREVTVSQSFRMEDNESIEAVGFEIDTANLRAEVTVEANGQTVGAAKVTQQKGFYMVQLDRPLLAGQGTTVTLKIRYRGDGSDEIRVVYEEPGAGGIGLGDSSSYIYMKPSSGTFLLNNMEMRGDARMKLYTKKAGSAPAPSPSSGQPSAGNASISLSRSSLTLYEGEAAGLSASVTPASSGVTWSSSNPSVASVNGSGRVTGHRDGTAVITASAGGKTASCTVTVQTRDPVEAFVYRMYRICLLREPDEGGLNHWTAMLKSGALSGADVAAGFYTSEEMRNRNLSSGEFVERAYEGILGRKPDSVGKKHWSSFLDKGVSYGFIVSGFIHSAEYTEICQRYGIVRGDYTSTEPRDADPEITGFASRLYRMALGRGYDVGGLNLWCSVILQNPTKDTMVNVATSGFLHSEEFLNKHLSDEEYIKVLYRTFLGRNYEAAGLNHWVTQLRNGATRDSIAIGFAYSQEFAHIMGR